jgi:hypothetical protein
VQIQCYLIAMTQNIAKLIRHLTPPRRIPLAATIMPTTRPTPQPLSPLMTTVRQRLIPSPLRLTGLPLG